MAKIDKVKEKLALLRFWLGIVVATFITIIGFVVTKYKEIELWLLILSFFIEFALILACAVILKIANKFMDILEEL